jgi:hypothetical protein
MNKIPPKPAEAGTAEPILPEDLLTYLGPASIIIGESQDDFMALIQRVGRDINPQDFVEWIWVKDIADMIWEARRIRRVRDAAINRGIRKRAMSLIREHFEFDGHSQSDLDEISARAEQGEMTAIQALNQYCIGARLDFADIASASVHASMENMQTLDLMLARIDRRRDQLLKDIELRRSAISKRLRQTWQREVDAEDVTPVEDNADGGASSSL